MLKPDRIDRRSRRILFGFAVASAAILFVVAAFVAIQAWPALRSIGPLRWWTDEGWHPAMVAQGGQFELSAMLVGTLATAVGAMLVALPLGIAAAVFVEHYAPRPVAVVSERLLELMAGVPSVVYGLWGLATVAPWLRRIEPPGTSLLAGVFVLVLMVLPTVALLTLAALRAVPTELLRGAVALGLGRAGLVWRVALPTARQGVVVAGVLAMTRALGETMAVLMVCGNVVQLPSSVFDPVRTLTANVALELGYASGDHRSALFVSGLLLLAVVASLIVACDLHRRGCQTAGQGAAG